MALIDLLNAGLPQTSICKQTNKTQHLQSVMKSGTPVPSSLTVDLGVILFHFSGLSFFIYKIKKIKRALVGFLGVIKGDNM